MRPLPPEQFVEFCQWVWGPDWKSRGAPFLEKSVRQLRNLETGECKTVSKALRRRIIQIANEHAEVINAWLRIFNE